MAKRGSTRPIKLDFQHPGQKKSRNAHDSLFTAMTQAREIARVQRGEEGDPQAEVWVWVPDGNGGLELYAHYDADNRPPIGTEENDYTDRDDDLLSLT